MRRHERFGWVAAVGVRGQRPVGVVRLAEGVEERDQSGERVAADGAQLLGFFSLTRALLVSDL